MPHPARTAGPRGNGDAPAAEDLSWVPEELRVAYHILKNAHLLPPEAELLKEIHALEDRGPKVILVNPGKLEDWSGQDDSTGWE